MRDEMTIAELKQSIASGKFHHATYRNQGTLWEGLWIYETDATKPRGFAPLGFFPGDTPEEKEAHALVAHTGVSLGSFGNG